MNKVLLQEKTKNEQKQTLQEVLLQEKQANCKNFATRKYFKKLSISEMPNFQCQFLAENVLSWNQVSLLADALIPCDGRME